MKQKIREAGLDWDVDSAGTGHWHAGQLPDRRSIVTAGLHGIDITDQRARQFQVADFDRFDKIMTHFDEPYADSSCFPTAQLCKSTSQQVKVVLSGDGGDELYGGYLRFRASLIAEKMAPFKSFISLAANIPGLKNSLQLKLKRFHNALCRRTREDV